MRKLYAIPTVATLYLLILTFVFIFFPTEILGDFAEIADSVISQAFFIIIIIFVAVGILCGILGIISSIICLVKGEDPLAMAKTAMTVKLCLTPAYIILFGCGFVFFCGGIFTLAFLIAIIVADYCVLLITGLFNTLSILRAVQDGKTSLKGNVRYILLQLIYCADVVASILFYRKLKKLYSAEPHPIEE